MKILKILIFFIIFTNFIFLGFLLTPTSYTVYERIRINVTRIIDGDTFESDIGNIRLLGINTPEKNQFYYEQAKQFLQQLEGKIVEVEIKEKDKYGRNLAYLFFQDKNINEKILSQGLAHLYVYDEDVYYDDLEKAEEKARNLGLGIWKKSSNFGCIDLVELKYEENKRCENEEQLILKNNCQALNLTLKDDTASHLYKININENEIFEKNFSCVWNNAGDSLFLYDDKGLILFYRY